MERSAKLDLLRILLCAGVFYSHFNGRPVIALGSVCVMGFFVLSGYLMQASFYRMEAGFDTVGFYRAKAKRFLPLYALAIAFSYVAALFMDMRLEVPFPQPAPDVADFSVFRYANLCNVPAWFMGCLCLFILIAPFLYYLHTRKGGIALLFAAAVAYTAFLYTIHDGTSFTKLGMQAALYYSPWARLWEFLAGMLACRVFRSLSSSTRSRLWPYLCLVLAPLLVGLVVWVSIHYNRGYSLPNSFPLSLMVIPMMALLVVMGDDHRAFSSHRLTRAVAWAASLAYPVYLFQWPLVPIAMAVVGSFAPGCAYALVFAFSLLACVGFSAVVDWLCRKVR